jgi:hypothetical protein
LRCGAAITGVSSKELTGSGVSDKELSGTRLSRNNGSTVSRTDRYRDCTCAEIDFYRLHSGGVDAPLSAGLSGHCPALTGRH